MRNKLEDTVFVAFIILFIALVVRYPNYWLIIYLVCCVIAWFYFIATAEDEPKQMTDKEYKEQQNIHEGV